MTEKIISEQIPTKSNPTSGFEPAFKKYHFKCNLTFCKISAQTILETHTAELLQKFQKTKPFKNAQLTFFFFFHGFSIGEKKITEEF